MRFIDLVVYSIYSTGIDTPMRLAHHARDLGIELGLCDSTKFEQPSGVRALGIEVVARNKREFRDRLRNLRNEWDYVVVPGGSDVTNRLAAGDDRVDILAHPDLGRRDSGMDSFIAREASENGVAIDLNIGGLVAARGGHRVNLCRNIQRNLRLSRKYGFELIACTGARSRYDLRSGECTYELLMRLGFTHEEATSALYDVPLDILEGSR